MISNYIRPQQIIRQNLTEIFNGEENELNAFVFGPKFHLSRYTNDEERAQIPGVEFSENAFTLPYTNVSSSWEIDKDFTKVFAEGLEAELARFLAGDSETVFVKNVNESNKLRLVSETPKSKFILGSDMENAGSGYSTGTGNATTSTGSGSGLTVDIEEVSGGSITRFKLNGDGTGYSAGDVITISGGGTDAEYKLTADDLQGVELRGNSKSSQFFGRDTNIGDLIRVTHNGETRTRSIVGFEKELIQSKFGSNTDKNDELASNNDSNPVTTASAAISNNVAVAGFPMTVVDADSWNGLVEGARFGSEYGEKYILTITNKPTDSAPGNVRIRSNSNLFSANNVPIEWNSAGAYYEVRDRSGELNVQNVIQPLDVEINAPGHGLSVGDRVTVTDMPSVPDLDGKTFFVSNVAGDDFRLENTSAVTITGYSSAEGTVGKAGQLGGLVVRITPSSGTDGPTENSQFSFVVKGEYSRLEMSGSDQDLSINGVYNGPSNTTYAITVIEGSTGYDGFNGAKVRVSDLNGIDGIQDYTISNSSFALGSFGLSFKFEDSGTTVPQEGLRAGDVYTVSVVAEATTGDESIAVLNGSVVDTTTWTLEEAGLTELDNVQFRISFSGEITPKRNNAPVLAWTAGDALSGISIESGLSLFVEERNVGSQWVPFRDDADSSNKVFDHYRAFISLDQNSPIEKINSRESIIEYAGKIDPDNTLSFGLYAAWEGSQNSVVYGLGLNENSLDGYKSILRRVENVDNVYAFCPLTFDEDVINLVKDHVNEFSNNDNQLWRRAYVATQSPGSFKVLDKDTDGTVSTAVIAPINGENIRVTAENADFAEANIKPGDLFRINFTSDVWGDLDFEEYKVKTVVGEKEIILQNGPTNAITAPTKFEIWKPDNGETQSDFVAAKSKELADRRVANIWVDNPIAVIDGEDVELPSYYVAAEVAGLRSALTPQQGLTFTEIQIFDKAPLMFTKYGKNQLNNVASNGTFIITQEKVGGTPFIRHQLTTQTDKGILFYEDSVGANFDSISFKFKDLFDKFIGKRNNTTGTLQEMRRDFRAKLFELTRTTLNNRQLGPQILEIDRESLSIERDPVFADRVNAKVRVSLPTPLNNAFIEITATTNTQL